MVIGLSPGMDLATPEIAAFMPMVPGSALTLAAALEANTKAAGPDFQIPLCFTIRGLQRFGRVDALSELVNLGPGGELHLEVSGFGQRSGGLPVRPKVRVAAGTPCEDCARLSLRARTSERDPSVLDVSWQRPGDRAPTPFGKPTGIAQGAPTFIDNLYMASESPARRVAAVLRVFHVKDAADVKRVHEQLQTERGRLARSEATRIDTAGKPRSHGLLHQLYRHLLWKRGTTPAPSPFNAQARPAEVQCGPRYPLPSLRAR